MNLFVFGFLLQFVQCKPGYDELYLKNKRTRMIQKINDLVSSHNVMVHISVNIPRSFQNRFVLTVKRRKDFLKQRIYLFMQLNLIKQVTAT